MAEDNDGECSKTKSESDEEPKVSKVSLTLKSNKLNLTDATSLTVTSLVQINNDSDSDERPSTSKELTTEITLIYARGNILESIKDNLLNRVENYHTNMTVAPVEEVTKPVPPPYTPYEESASIFEPREIQITPAPEPPLVLYSAPPLQGAPPTYSAIMRIGPVTVQPRRSIRLFGRRQEVRLEPSPPFIAPIPPPTYTESQGISMNQQRTLVPAHYTMDLEDSLWGTSPVSVICPICNSFVITNVHCRRSYLTHFTALTLCICGCWPCCLLPYCIDSCKTTYHVCPMCFTTIGVHNP